ncbi:MAG: GH3 auxin-responsive promoter family protein [Victivallales bacterium]|nr:GH3 auxin-responsive promoter family protein [Victivallales bacterium]
MTNWIDTAQLTTCNLAWLLSCLPDYAAFHAGCNAVASVQMSKLASLLHANADTEFGRRWQFGKIRSYADWNNALPVQEYEDIEPYIEQIKAGGQNLLTRDKVLLLEPTSGSSGVSKLIPYTQGLKREFQSGISAWIADIFLAMPSLLTGRSYWSISPPTQRDFGKSAVKIGFDDDSQYLGRIARLVARRVMAVPPDFTHAKEYLAACPRLAFLSVWSPTFLDSLFGGDVECTLAMRSVRFISAWGDGASAQFTPLISRYFPQAPFQPKGLISTECFASFPLFATDHKAALAYRSHFFEFKNSHGDLHPVQEVQEGEPYTLVVSTAGGLYRYNTHDIVKVIGTYHAIPLIQFLGRDNRVSDFFGEKLNETFVANACRRIFDECHIAPAFHLMTFAKDHYLLLLDCKNADFNALSQLLETELQKNYHYENCIKLGQLKPVRCLPCPDGAAQYIAFCQSKGMKLGDIKFREIDTSFSTEQPT